MNTKIKQFYADKGLHINKLIKRRPRGIKPGQVLAGAERYYYKYQNGYRPEKELFTALEVWSLAEEIDYEEYTERDKLIDKTEQIAQENRDLKAWLIFLCVLSYILSIITLFQVWGVDIWRYLNVQ